MARTLQQRSQAEFAFVREDIDSRLRTVEEIVLHESEEGHEAPVDDDPVDEEYYEEPAALNARRVEALGRRFVDLDERVERLYDGHEAATNRYYVLARSISGAIATLIAEDCQVCAFASARVLFGSITR